MSITSKTADEIDEAKEKEYLKRIEVFAAFSSFIWHVGAKAIAISSCLTAPDRVIVSEPLYKNANRHHELKEAVEA